MLLGEHQKMSRITKGQTSWSWHLSGLPEASDCIGSPKELVTEGNIAPPIFLA